MEVARHRRRVEDLDDVRPRPVPRLHRRGHLLRPSGLAHMEQRHHPEHADDRIGDLAAATPTTTSTATPTTTATPDHHRRAPARPRRHRPRRPHTVTSPQLGCIYSVFSPGSDTEASLRLTWVDGGLRAEWDAPVRQALQRALPAEGLDRLEVARHRRRVEDLDDVRPRPSTSTPSRSSPTSIPPGAPGTAPPPGARRRSSRRPQQTRRACADPAPSSTRPPARRTRPAR